MIFFSENSCCEYLQAVTSSLVPVLNKLPDHHNLPLFDDLLHFWYQSRVSLFVLLGFFVSIKTISFDIKLN